MQRGLTITRVINVSLSDWQKTVSNYLEYARYGLRFPFFTVESVFDRPSVLTGTFISLNIAYFPKITD